MSQVVKITANFFGHLIRLRFFTPCTYLILIVNKEALFLFVLILVPYLMFQLTELLLTLLIEKGGYFNYFYYHYLKSFSLKGFQKNVLHIKNVKALFVLSDLKT